MLGVFCVLCVGRVLLNKQVPDESKNILYMAPPGIGTWGAPELMVSIQITDKYERVWECVCHLDFQIP